MGEAERPRTPGRPPRLPENPGMREIPRPRYVPTARTGRVPLPENPGVRGRGTGGPAPVGLAPPRFDRPAFTTPGVETSGFETPMFETSGFVTPGFVTSPTVSVPLPGPDPGPAPVMVAAEPPPTPAAPAPATPPTPQVTVHRAFAVPASAPGQVADDGARAAFKALAGSRFNTHLRMVVAAMAQVPTLRGADVGAARVELAAVRAYLHDGDGALAAGVLDDALRSAAESVAPAAADRAAAYGACLAAGLRRLPVHRGPVYRAFRFGPGQADRYRPGSVMFEPAAVRSRLAPRGLAEGGYLIWSEHARRTAVLTEDDDTVDAAGEVVFAPGTRFLVTGRETVPDGGAPLVLLAELPAGAGPEQGTGPDVAGRLAGLVPQVGGDGGQPADVPQSGLLIGLREVGRLPPSG